MIPRLPAKLVRTEFRKYLFPVCLVFASGCNNSTEPYKPLDLSGLTMGTTYSVTINEPELDHSPVKIKQRLDQELEHINAVMSTYIAGSELSRLNQSSSTDWIPLSTELFEVIETAQQVSQQSQGAFDVTAGALVNIWGFGPAGQQGRAPDPQQIAEALSMTGYEMIHLDKSRNSLRKEFPGIYIDLSGIGQGYAVDVLAKILENEFGIHNYLVEISGDLRAKGVNPKGENWRIGIEQPAADNNMPKTILDLDNRALSTSGNYRNYFEADGVHYSHIINPATGMPISHRLVSVSVLDERCMIADAWDTALLVLGPEQGLQLANQLGLATLFIVRTENGFRELKSNRLQSIMSDAP